MKRHDDILAQMGYQSKDEWLPEPVIDGRKGEYNLIVILLAFFKIVVYTTIIGFVVNRYRGEMSMLKRGQTEGKVKVGTYLDPALVDRLRKSAADNKRGISDEVSVALEFYLAYGTESAANRLIAALEKAGISTAQDI